MRGEEEREEFHGETGKMSEGHPCSGQENEGSKKRTITLRQKKKRETAVRAASAKSDRRE